MEKSTLKVKEEVVNQPWAHLAQDGRLVLFCKGMGRLIVPSPSASPCRSWQQVPPGQNYLAAHGIDLSLLLENQAKSRLSDRLLWEFRQLVRREEKCTSNTCSVTQDL